MTLSSWPHPEEELLHVQNGPLDQLSTSIFRLFFRYTLVGFVQQGFCGGSYSSSSSVSRAIGRVLGCRSIALTPSTRELSDTTAPALVSAVHVFSKALTHYSRSLIRTSSLSSAHQAPSCQIMTRTNLASLIARIPGRRPSEGNNDPSSNTSSCKTPHKFRSQSSTCSGDPSSVFNCTSSPGVGSAKLYVNDEELHARARAISAEIDFEALTNLSLSKWTWKEDRNEFTLFEANAPEDHQLEVLAAGDVNCSIEEIVALLRSLNEVDLNATMKALHQKDFIYGSLVHLVPSSSLEKEPEQQQSEEVISSHDVENYVAVKTNTFVRSAMFARNEEWCFLESFERSPTGDSLVISQSSIPACSLKVGKVQHLRVDQLSDITTAFLVERIPRTRSVRLVFHGKVDNDTVRARFTKRDPTLKMASARLIKLANSVSRIPDLVRRRRLGVQKFADRTAFVAKNSRCICCTKNLRVFLFKKRQRCHLCAYNVCDQCCSQETMETFNGQTTSVLMCTRCMECVDSCEYSGVSTQSRSRAIRVELDTTGSSTTRQRGKALVEIIEAALEDPDEASQTAAETVIQLIKTRTGAILERHATAHDLSWKTDQLNAFRNTLELGEACPPSLDECVLANADSRNYHIHVPERPATNVPDYPLPENEAQRLFAIHENDFVNLGEVLELNIICALAAEALQCRISMITVIDQESEFILSCNTPYLHRTWMARNQTFCSHLIMDSKPLLVRNPGADVRFFNMDAVTKRDIRFYCGFPISAQDGTIVGSVCCLDVEQRDLTQSQYSMMTTLARTASKVIQARASAQKAGLEASNEP